MSFLISEISECDSYPCRNNGTCADVHSGLDDLLGSGESPYVCICKPGFTGKNCKTGKKYYCLRQFRKSAIYKKNFLYSRKGIQIFLAGFSVICTYVSLSNN